MPTKEESRQALVDSIKEWNNKLRLLKEDKYDAIVMGRDGCPLCWVHGVYCTGCPVMLRINYYSCVGTPYSKASAAKRMLIVFGRESDRDEAIKAFKDEIAFLNETLVWFDKQSDE